MTPTDRELPVEVLSDQGFAYLSIREWDEALKVAKELEERRFSAAYDIAAQAHAGLGDVEEAIRVLERGVEKAPRAWPNWQLLGNYRSDLGRFDEAEAAYEAALGCPGVWESSVRLNQAVLAGRRDRFEEMLGLLDAVTDEELALTAAEHRIHGLDALGRHEEAEAVALPVLAAEHDPETEGPTMARIAARVASIRLARGVDEREVREYAHESLRYDTASQAILTLLRRMDDERSKTARYLRMVAKAQLRETDPRFATLPRYHVTYDVVADSEEEGLAYVRAFEEFFPEGEPAEWSVAEVVDLESRPDDPKGVYWRSGRSTFEEEPGETA
jgi:tetratricopeptide (TPR) repeat protein